MLITTKTIHGGGAMKPYTHFTPEERECLYVLIKLNKKPAEIAREIGKDRSSVSRELQRNRNKKGEYCPWGAYSKYRCRRRRCIRHYRIQKGTPLYDFIRNALKQFWSPEIIAAKWNEEHPEDHISFTTIYLAVKRGEFDPISEQSHLRRRGRKKYGSRSKFNTIHPEHTIQERPEQANTRERVGDFEGDTVKGSHGKGCIVTYVDRKSRKVFAAVSKDMSSKSIYRATRKAFGKVRPKTITLDNGSEFAMFKDIEKALKTTVYFADPHSPWQRGSNENINDCFRFFFPKGFDFRTLSDRELQHVVDLINSRPRFCLNLLSPNHVFCCT